MAEKDAVREPGAEPADTPTLELPSLFGRRKKRDKKAPPAEPPLMQDEPPLMQDEPPRVTTGQADAPVTETVEPPLVQDEPPARTAEPAVAAEQSADLDDEDELEEGRTRRTRRTPRLPALAASTAAVAVGAVVGLLGSVLTLLGLKSCELITGTDSCGGPGLLLLIVIVVVMILAGAALLRLFTVDDATNLSFLGVGITVAVVLMFLLGYLYEPWMFLVMPVLTALAFLLARWITTRYVEDVLADDDEREVHDIR